MKRATKEQLINEVIENIKKDVYSGDLTAVDELLRFIPTKYLIGYLPEEEWYKYMGDDRRYMCDNCGGGFKENEMVFDVNDNDLCKGCNMGIEHSSFMNGGK